MGGIGGEFMGVGGLSGVRGVWGFRGGWGVKGSLRGGIRGVEGGV